MPPSIHGQDEFSQPLYRLGRLLSPTGPAEASALIGRGAELRRLLIDFSDQETVPVLVGPPGIGKTSLLVALRSVLVGFDEVVEVNQLQSCRPLEANRLVIEARCDASMTSLEDLAAHLFRRIEQAFQEPKERKFSLRDFQLESTTPLVKGKATWEAIEPRSTTVVGRLREKFDGLQSAHTDEIVVLLDECEQFRDLPNLLDFTREFATANCRFVCALRDQAAHKLADPGRGDRRWTARITVGRLDRPSIELFYARLAEALADFGFLWSWPIESVNYVVEHSAGEPWYLQMLGYELIFDPELELEKLSPSGGQAVGRHRVTVEDLRRAEQRLMESRLSGLHSSMYDRIASGAPKREELVRSLALYPATHIPRAFVNHVKQRGIRSADTTLRWLLDLDNSPIATVASSGGTLLEFADHQFRVFARLCPPTDEMIEVLARRHVETWFDGSLL